MGNFGNKWNKFVQIFIEKNGYVKVVQGLQNTLLIAVVGMLIGVLIGTIIATVRVLPKYKTLPRALNAVCSFYVGLFRGTPMVVQLLIFYYVMLPLMGIKLPGVRVAMVVFGLNSGAYISEIMRSGIQSVDPGQLEAGRAVGLGFGPVHGLLFFLSLIHMLSPGQLFRKRRLVKEYTGSANMQDSC